MASDSALWCVMVCFGALWCVIVCFGALWCVWEYHIVLRPVLRSVLQRVVYVLQCVAAGVGVASYGASWCVMVCCSVLQRVVQCVAASGMCVAACCSRHRPLSLTYNLIGS